MLNKIGGNICGVGNNRTLRFKSRQGCISVLTVIISVDTEKGINRDDQVYESGAKVFPIDKINDFDFNRIIWVFEFSTGF